MKENIQIKLFTAADLRQYFMHSQPVELLSEKVINHTRAYATIMNPYAKDDTAVVSAVFVDGEVAAFTYVIPDEQDGKPIYWNTVLSVDPKYEGRGYGAIVIGQMVEVYGDSYFDLDAVPASVENLKFAGLQVDYVEQYVLEQKHINTKSLKGKLVAAKEAIRMNKAYKALQRGMHAPYTLRYTQFIDDTTYAFIKAHSEDDLFLRSQQMFNWILAYPLGQESPIAQRVVKQCAFDSAQSCFRLYAVQVYMQNQLVGVYVIRRNANELYINYMYYDSDFEKEVFASVAEHLLIIKPSRIFTAHKSLADYVDNLHIYIHRRIYNKTFSHPKSFVYDTTKFIQAGDGDNIT